MRTSRKLAMCFALGVGFFLAVPIAAGAAQKDVSMGPPRAAQKALQPTGSDVNDFFPHQVTVHVGDTVRFVPNGFHTVDLPAQGRTRRLLPFVPTGQPIAGSVDAAGAPFWFNGQSLVGFNPALFTSAFGKRRAYTGARAVLSGIPQSERPKPMTVRFNRTGTFRYFCDIHLGMTGNVRVVRGSRAIPSGAADRRTLRRQVASTLATAKALAKSRPPASPIVNIGAEAKGNVSMFAFVPSALTVPAGTTVTFRMDARTEIHTATIGPGDPEKQPQSYLGQLEVGQQGGAVLDPRLAFPSEPPGALATLTPTFHGNGFWNSGVLDEDPTTSTVPATSAVRFAAPGTYQVFCMIHPFMHATVTVQ
jgi:plastocyanin